MSILKIVEIDFDHLDNAMKKTGQKLESLIKEDNIEILRWQVVPFAYLYNIDNSDDSSLNQKLSVYLFVEYRNK